MPGLKVGHTCLPIWPTEQSRCDPHITHLWPTCWNFLFKVANITWQIFDMEQCHRFLHSWQDTELIPCTNFLKIKSLDTTCFKTACNKNKLFSHQWYFSAFIRPQVHSLTRCQHCFLKNMWYPGQIQII